MSYTYKTQANVTRSNIESPELNLNFKTITLPQPMVEDCLRATPNNLTTRYGAKSTTFQDVCEIVTLYLSGFKRKEIQRIVGKSNAVVGRCLKYAACAVKRKELHEENRVRNMLGKELAKAEEYMYD